MRKIIPLLAVFGLAGCVTTSNNNANISDAQVLKCKELAEMTAGQDSSFQPSRSIVSSDLQVTAEDYSDGILSCSVRGVSYSGYAIAYDEKTDIYLAEKYTGSNKNGTLYHLTKKVSVEEQRLKDLELAEIEREEKEQRQAVRREARKERVKFCWDFGQKYTGILSEQGMKIDKVTVYNSWDSGDTVTCINTYYSYWTDSLGNKRTERMRDQHIINKESGKFETIFR